MPDETPDQPLTDTKHVERLARSITPMDLQDTHIRLSYTQASKVIDTLRALSAALKEPEWQPIETAPKDGTEICAWVGPGDLGGWLQLSYYKDNGAEAWRDWDGDIWHPTHWMPLPEPPKGDAKGTDNG